MDDSTSRVTARHLERRAYVYVRQSTTAQLERNQESTRRQYGLVDRAVALGWTRERVEVVDDDLGVSGSGTTERAGFAQMTAEVALGHVGIVLGLEVSRLARNNADWYRLLDLCSVTATLIGDSDGLYDASSVNDRLVLGLKGTMSEAELHTLRARLAGGITNKAQRGELRRSLPVGLVWGDDSIETHPDEAVRGVIDLTFAKFDELGSARAVWLYLADQNIDYPVQLDHSGYTVKWVPVTYPAVHKIVTHPCYAGTYVYGKTRQERYVNADGQVRTRRHKLARDQWQVIIENHFDGYITWEKYMANQDRLSANNRPRRHRPGTGAIREGSALLQGIARCGHCGRKLATHYSGKNSTPGYHCAGKTLVNGRGQYCLNIGGVQIDRAVAEAFVEALTPAALDAALGAEADITNEFDTTIAQHQRTIERLGYETQKAERRYLAVDPDNRLVARGLETEWEQRLRQLQDAETELADRQRRRPQALTGDQRDQIRRLADDIDQIWSADTTTDRDRKELLHTLLEEVTIRLEREQRRADLTLRWKGGTITDIAIALRRPQPKIRTDDDTIALIERLAAHYPDSIIAGILNRQGRLSATGQRFSAQIVSGLRNHRNIAPYTTPKVEPEGDIVTIAEAARRLELAPSTLHRWLNDGFIAGEQPTPGAPWQIRLTEDLKGLFVDEPPKEDGWMAMLEATLALGVTRQTILQRVKRGELNAVHVRKGKRKGLRIQVKHPQPDLFNTDTNTERAV